MLAKLFGIKEDIQEKVPLFFEDVTQPMLVVLYRYFGRPISSVFTGGGTKRKSLLTVQFVSRSKHSASQLQCVERK